MDSLHLDGNLKLEGNARLKDAKQFLLGAPADYTQSNRVGARNAPLEMRKAFLELEKDWEKIRFADLGNIEPVLGDMEKTCGILKDVLGEALLKTKATPIILGGEHTITYGAVEAIKPDVVVWFDAHADLKDEYMNQQFCHATVAKKIRELDIHLIQVGIRSQSLEEKETSKNQKIIQLKGDDAGRLSKLVSRKKVYVSIDLDVLDPGVAPGVGNPEPAGLSLNTLMLLIDTVIESSQIIGLDLVEACPQIDGGLACLNGASIIKHVMEK